MQQQHGVFITFEGSEGCGKTTQIERLAKRLQAEGIEVLVTREPGGTPLGESIRHLLKFAEEGRDMVPETELLLFAASRAQLVRRVIEPALEEGRWVVADRFMDSTTVYQGIARCLDYEDVAVRRLKDRPNPSDALDRMEQMLPEFYEAVREGYLALAREEPARFRVIHAEHNADAVEEEIWEHVQGLMGK